MSAEANKTIVRRFLTEVINQGSQDAVSQVCAPDLTWHGGSVGEYHDLASFLQGVAPFFTAFPDLTVTIDDLIAEGDCVTARYTWHATQRGEFFGIPPTGKSVTVTGISIYRVAGDKIVEEWWQEDLLGLMQQLGAIPAPGASAAV